jgi:hypothetical protein
MEKLAVGFDRGKALMDWATEWEVTEEILEVVDDQQVARPLTSLPA